MRGLCRRKDGLMKEITRIITEKTVRKFITIEDAIGRIEDTWRWYGEGKIVMPTKVTTDMSSVGIESWFNSMPSYIGPSDMAGLKVVGGYSENAANGLPYIRATMVLLDSHSGYLKAVMAGDTISAYRTGAQPAVICKYMAASTAVVTIIGAGFQAHMTLKCMAAVLDIKEVRVCDIRPEARKKFVEDYKDYPFRMVDCETNEEGCLGSDVIITITTADAALVEEPWVKKGALVLTMGSYTEISEELVLKADKLFVDHMGQGLHRGNFKAMVDAGKITADSFAGVITDIVAGKTKGRENPDERIIVAIVGMGSLDLSLAALIYERAIDSGEDVLTVEMETG